jgi:feruloyl esterase
MDSKGKPMYLGYSPGGEPGPNGWGGWISGGGAGKSLQYAFGTNFFKYMVFDNPDWDIKTFSVEHDMKVADDKVGQILNATDANLKKFKDRGGKLIVYHGWSDAAIPPVNAIEYYKSVVAKMGAKQTDQFVRLFMVPGMQHCGGGPGPSNFGQTSDVESDALHDVNRAVEQWVENGAAPKQIIATKYKGTNAASGVERTRPLCPYPQVAQWKGSGSTDEAANFTCVSGVRAATR